MSKCFPFGGSYSVNTNTGTATGVCWLVASFYSVGFARVISLGFHHRASAESASKLWKWPTVTGFWHSLHLGMMSTFDILALCPKIIIIPQLSSSAGPLQLWVMNILHHPPFSFSIYTWLSSLSPLPSVWLFIHLPTFLLILSFSSAHHPSSHPLLLHLHPVILFLSIWLQCNQPSLLFLAESDLLCCSHNSGIIYILLTHSLFPFTSSLPNLSACMSALSPFCQLIPAIYSIKCFCIPSAFLFTHVDLFL